jgi:hypothetical protein
MNGIQIIKAWRDWLMEHVPGYPAWAYEAILMTIFGVMAGFLVRIIGRFFIPSMIVGLIIVGIVYAVDAAVVQHGYILLQVWLAQFSWSFSSWKVIGLFIQKHPVAVVTGFFGFMVGWFLGRA